MADLFISIVCATLGFIIGYITHTIVESSLEQFLFSRSRRIPAIKMTRYDIGNVEFGVTLFKLKGQPEEGVLHYGHQIMEQIEHLQSTTEQIVGLVIGYDLRWIMGKKFDSVMQAEIDLFVKNIERFNRFLQQPPVVVECGLDEALTELRLANQPILNHLGKIKQFVTSYVNEGEYKLIEFNQ